MSIPLSQAQSALEKAKGFLDKGQNGLAVFQFEKIAKGKHKDRTQAQFLAAVAYSRQSQYAEAIRCLLPLETDPLAVDIRAEVAELLGSQYLLTTAWAAGAARLAPGPEPAQRALFTHLGLCPSDTLSALARQYTGSVALQTLALLRNPPKPKPSSIAAGAELRIALVLPLSLPTSLDADFKANQTMAEFCSGALLAQADARQEGFPITLSFYDTHHNADTLARILAHRDLESMHLLVGPIYNKEIPALAAYAGDHKIPLLNPLTSQSLPAGANSYTYLAEPTYKDMTAAVHALRPGPAGRRVAIFYGTSLKDSLLATAFAETTRLAGGVVAMSKKVAKNSAANMPKFITEAGLDSTSILFVPNGEPLVKAQLLSALEITKTQALAVTYGSWLEETEVPLERFERLGVRLLYPDYPAYGNPAAEAVRARILAMYGLPATEVGLKAYDLVYTLGKTLSQAKPEARPTFLRDYSPIRSLFWAGYDYTLGQSNAQVPIYHVADGKLELE